MAIKPAVGIGVKRLENDCMSPILSSIPHRSECVLETKQDFRILRTCQERTGGRQEYPTLPTEVGKGLLLYNQGAWEGERDTSTGPRRWPALHQPGICLAYLFRPISQGSKGQLSVVHFWPFSEMIIKCIWSGRKLHESLLVTERPLGYRSYVYNFI